MIFTGHKTKRLDVKISQKLRTPTNTNNTRGYNVNAQ